MTEFFSEENKNILCSKIPIVLVYIYQKTLFGNYHKDVMYVGKVTDITATHMKFIDIRREKPIWLTIKRVSSFFEAYYRPAFL